MIEGFKVDVKSGELKKHMEARVEYHGKKARFYAEKADELRKGGMEAGQGYSQDPVSSLMSSVKSHERKAAYFKFIADHIIPDEMYRLDENDLGRLEILDRIL